MKYSSYTNGYDVTRYEEIFRKDLGVQIFRKDFNPLRKVSNDGAGGATCSRIPNGIASKTTAGLV